MPVINATEGGARIGNTLESTLEELIDGLKTPANSPEEILKKVINEKCDNVSENLYKGITSAIDDICEILRLSEVQLKGEISYEDDIFRIVYRVVISS